MQLGRSIPGKFATLLCLALMGSAAEAQTSTPSSEFKVVCGHDCLQEFVERFLTAITTGDATAAPLAPNVRYTKNGQTLAIGDALWATAQGLGGRRSSTSRIPISRASRKAAAT